MKRKLESSELVPHPSSVAKHFTPSGVEQSGLGPAFFAVVIAIIALLLLSVFGNNYLTGAYHIPGGSDLVKLTDVSFAPTTTSVTYGAYRGSVSAVRVSLATTPSSDLVFKFPRGAITDITRSAYVVVKKIDATALPVGTVFYAGAGAWQISSLGGGYASGPGHRNYFYSAGAPLYTSSSAIGSQSKVSFWFDSSLNSYPSDFVTVLPEISGNLRFFANGTWDEGSGTRSYWVMGWDNSNPIDLQYIQYGYPYIDVAPNFASPAGSILRRADSTQVTIRYAYDTRIR